MGDFPFLKKKHLLIRVICNLDEPPLKTLCCSYATTNFANNDSLDKVSSPLD